MVTLIATILSATAAVISAAVAYVAVGRQSLSASTEAFSRITDTLESDRFREYRRIIYRLDRDNFPDWDDHTRLAVDAWLGFFDLVASLIAVEQVDKPTFLYMYGDVALRTAYQVAPYCNCQIEERGDQFELPFRRLIVALYDTWVREAQRNQYPHTIGFPSKPKITLNPELFLSDPHLIDFRPLGSGGSKKVYVWNKVKIISIGRSSGTGSVREHQAREG
jgi:hypothetical protein